ncbi:MAG: hypothetical protein QG670_2780 [Thermoproteota archaeon]|nr:hypothetical protein [Thermoproteota archaeon]
MNNSKAIYNFHESIINALKPTLEEGIRSVIVISPTRTDHAQRFIDHVHRHHMWLVQGLNKAIFSKATGNASTLSDLTTMIRTPIFHRLINDTTSEETEGLVDVLERYLNTPKRETCVLFSLSEIGDLIFNPKKLVKPKPEYLLLTDKYLSNSKEKNKMYQLMQIAENRNVKTRIIGAESPAGLRLTQLGGVVCLCTS